MISDAGLESWGFGDLAAGRRIAATSRRSKSRTHKITKFGSQITSSPNHEIAKLSDAASLAKVLDLPGLNVAVVFLKR